MIGTEPPAWAQWNHAAALSPWTVGIEEEVMLLDPGTWALAAEIDSLLPRLGGMLVESTGAETHTAALELRTGAHAGVAGAAAELAALRDELTAQLAPLGLRAAGAGLHPFAVWQETRISAGERYQFLYGSMRELARREPTFALHVHIAVADGEAAVRALNRMRAHVPLLLALSANSPFWQGRDTGLASSRTPLFQAFPRVGIPRFFDGYADYVEAIDLLVRSGALPEPTFLWWDVRLQPRFGTIEIRIMDAQTRTSDTAALVALVQSLVRLEIDEGYVAAELVRAPEVLDENRFLAARDGVEAELIDPAAGNRRPLRTVLDGILEACRPHADRLGCRDELETAAELGRASGATRQLALAHERGGLTGLVEALAHQF